MRAPNIEERPAAPALAQAGPRTGRADLYIAASVVALGSTASILSSTVVNVAVPDRQRAGPHDGRPRRADDAGARPRSDRGWLAHPGIQLAMGLLGEHPRRHPGPDRRLPAPA